MKSFMARMNPKKCYVFFGTREASCFHVWDGLGMAGKHPIDIRLVHSWRISCQEWGISQCQEWISLISVVQHSQKWQMMFFIFLTSKVTAKFAPGWCFQVSTHCTAWKCSLSECHNGCRIAPAAWLRAAFPCWIADVYYKYIVIPMKPVNICKYHLSSNHLTINHQVTYLVHEHSLQPSLKGNRAQVESKSLMGPGLVFFTGLFEYIELIHQQCSNMFMQFDHRTSLLFRVSMSQFGSAKGTPPQHRSVIAFFSQNHQAA
jgi:hypothetical protein